MKRYLPLLALPALLGLNAHAAPEISTESGWSGSVNVGAGVGQSETNMLAGISSIDLGDDRISNLDSDAGSEDIGFPALQFQLNYTLGESQTQLYLRNQASPMLLADLQLHAGLRQQLGKIGIVEVSLSSTSVPTDVWKDPYLLNAKRGNTERTASGLHLGWHNIMSTGLSFELGSSDVEIDDEESGTSLSLSAEEQRLLRRTGEIYNYTLSYEWEINAQQRLTPSFSYLDYDYDGGAMAEDGMALQLEHSYTGQRWSFISSVFYRSLESKEDNPIYSDSADKDIIGAAVTALYAKPFGLDNWTANARVSVYDEDSDIDFYDTTLTLFSIGMLYRFD